MLTTPMTTTKQYGIETDDVFIHETFQQSPSDGFVGLPPPPPPPPPSPPPIPSVFNNNMNNNCKILLPHQEVNLVVNHANITEIQARSIPSMLISSNNIWTRCVLPNLRIKQSIFDQHFGDSKSLITNRYRRSSSSTSYIGGGGGGINLNDDGPLSFVLLDTTSKMLYDVPMRHLLQLVKKDYDDDASIDHVIRAIDETHMKSEWLDAVTALNKQFDKHPEDKARVLAHNGSTHGLVLIEQFFVKLVRVPAYEFKLIYLKFCEEAPTQLERMNKHINDLLESIEIILNNEQLPGILHLLCLLYNSITNKKIPGIHFDSLLSVLSIRTLKQNTTIAHLLCHLLEEQYSTLLNIFNNSILLKLKDLSLIKYIPIYIDINLLYKRYKQLNISLNNYEQKFIYLPEHIKITLNNLEILFTKLFNYENQIKQGEKNLSNYFCVYDLSLELCLNTLGQFIDKLHLAHIQNIEQHRRNQLLLLKQQRNIQTPIRSLHNTFNSYCSDTNIFRDHLNVPLTTPINTRQRLKINRTSRDRYLSSRDISYDEQIIQNLLPDSIPRKRGHSPTAKTVLTKRPFNVLGLSTTNKQKEEIDEVFISSTSDNKHEETNMDCSINESAIVPITNMISIDENQISSNLTISNQSLVDSTNDQSIPINDSILSIKYENDVPIKIHQYEQLEYSNNIENDINKENNLLLSSTQNSTESSSLPNIIDDTNQQLSSINNSHSEIHNTSAMRILSTHSKKLNKSSKRTSNIIEIDELNPQNCLKELNCDNIMYNNKQTFSSNEQVTNLNKSTNNSIDQQKTNKSRKSISSVENQGSISTNNIFNRNIQRCAVSRRISSEKDGEESNTISSTSTIQSQMSITNRRISSFKTKITNHNVHSVTNVSSFARPLRAFQMSSITTNGSFSSSKNIKKLSSTSQHHHLTTMQKTFSSRTILGTVLPLSTLVKTQKNN